MVQDPKSKPSPLTWDNGVDYTLQHKDIKGWKMQENENQENENTKS